MKRNLVFIIPSFLLLAFLAFKPPAIGPEKGNVIVTTEATVTTSTKPQLRDFDEEGKEPDHFDDHRKYEEENVIVTTETTVTPSTKPQLRDIDDDREHEEREHDFGVNEIHGHEHHDDDLDEDSSHEDD